LAHIARLAYTPLCYTVGKLEKWHDLYIRHWVRCGSLEAMVLWYNEEKPHGSLDLDIAETLVKLLFVK